ncbi:MAG: hypothetical protein R3223_09650 [Longimicrobiales bacterium]|nr:hypothetical protein [Longimicrobiales bacterium]
MFSKRQLLRLRTLTITGVVVAGLAACDDATGPDDDHGAHAEPVSVRLTLGGNEIASADVNGSTGEIHLESGQETGHITVEFLAEDGDVIALDPAEFYLEVDVADVSVAEFEQDTPGEFGGHAHAVSEGETTMVFKLMHGSVGSGHADFIPEGITAHVEAASP